MRGPRLLQDTVNNIIHNRDAGPAFQYLKKYGLIPSEAKCPACDKSMKWVKRKGRVFNWSWKCNRRCCTKFGSYHSAYFGRCMFAGSRLAPQQWVHIIYLWAYKYPVRLAVDQSGCNKSTICRCFKQIQRTIAAHFRANPVLLGAPGQIVQADETCLSFRPKYHRGRAPKSEVWVFGICDPKFKPAVGWCEIVADRSSPTLLNIIEDHVRPQSRINTDGWRGYVDIVNSPLDYEHRVIIHKYNFVDPIDPSVHTQAIESYWAKSKARIKAMNGIRREDLELFLRECSWRDQFQKDAFFNIISTISEVWDVYPDTGARDQIAIHPDFEEVFGFS